ncbi:MAG TPA: hypothetical protein VLW88_03900 [Hyphomicrobium sp.]|nr:hypothetical protein [Hyphomicrobium sp.]
MKKAAAGVLYGAALDGALQRAIRAILKQGSRARRFSALFPALQPQSVTSVTNGSDSGRTWNGTSVSEDAPRGSRRVFKLLGDKAMRRTTLFVTAAMLAALSGAAGAYADDSLSSSATALTQSDPLAPADNSTLSAPKSNIIPDQIPGQAADKAPAADAKPATSAETPAKSLTPNADAEAAKAAAEARAAAAARAREAAEARAAAASEGMDREEMMEARMEAQQERMEQMQDRAEMIGEMLSGD